MNPIIFTTDPSDSGKRLDQLLAERMPDQSRSRIQAWIKQDRVRINGVSPKASAILKGRETIEVTPAAPPPLDALPEALPIEVLYEDDAVIAVNKPAGLVVHAGAGHQDGTLVNRLVHHFESLSKVGGALRPGIVHRLDRYTSGVLLVAKTDRAHRALAQQFANRTTEKLYIAAVQGLPKQDSGAIDSPVARDPVRRTRMTTRIASGREAHTEFKVQERFEKAALLEVRIGTGRTHQIRVHLASIHLPVLGDTLYGAAGNSPGQPDPERFFLHAARIGFVSPATRRRTQVDAPLPDDLCAWLSTLRRSN